MLNFLATGTTLGLSAGFAPGPLLTLVISETLQYGVKAGIKVALAPILTDVPIILLSVFILGKLSYFDTALGLIALGGGCFIIYLGYTNLRIKDVAIDLTDIKPISLRKGILVNALNPHPYLVLVHGGRTADHASHAARHPGGSGLYRQFLLVSGGVENCLGARGRPLSILFGRQNVSHDHARSGCFVDFAGFVALL